MQKLFIAAALAATALSSAAADHVVNMLNTGKDGSMVFEPAYVKVAVGDTVVFKPTQAGAHYAASVLVPAGSKPFKGAVDTEFKLKIDKEGLYLYVCEPHRALGMAGVIQAGKPVNLAEAKTVAAKEQAGFAMGKDRFDKALAMVK
jgi:pseudoazurin